MVLEFLLGLMLMAPCSLAQEQVSTRGQAFKWPKWMNNNWALVFHITAGINVSAYKTYMNSSQVDDQMLTKAFLNGSCPKIYSQDRPGKPLQHFRSGLLNHWPSLYIDKVGVVVVDDGLEAAHALFNGTGSTFLSWFSADRLISTCWADLPSESHNFFSIKGDDIDRVLRRFFISHSYNDCPNDLGWLLVQDQKKEKCKWANLPSSSFPSILYSQRNTKINWNNAPDKGIADELFVAVSFLEKPASCP